MVLKRTTRNPKLNHSETSRRRLADPKDVGKLKEQIENQNLIKKCINLKDIETLKQISVKKGGFLNKSLRNRIWPMLLKTNLAPKLDVKNEPHHSEDQIKLDVNRSFAQFNLNISKLEAKDLKDKLETLLIRMMRSEPSLNYYQGFHDIASIILLTLNQKFSLKPLRHLSFYYLLDYMGENLIPATSQLDLIFELLKEEDKELHQFLIKNEVPNYFAISWLLTWGSHDIPEINTTSRLFDFYLSYGPIMPIYFSVELILHFRDQILNLEPDMATIHTFLSNLMKRLTLSDKIKEGQINIEEIIKQAYELYSENSLNKLQDLGQQLKQNQSAVLNRYTTFIGFQNKQQFEKDYKEIPEIIQLKLNKQKENIQDYSKTTAKKQLVSLNNNSTTVTIVMVILAMAVGAYYNSQVM